MLKLRLHIDGEWTAQEFSDFFESFQALSYYWMADMEYRFAPPKARDQSLGRLRRNNATLKVSEVSFASPGFTDLAGFGAVLSEIRQFLEFVIDRVIHREDRNIDREAKRLEILETRIRIERELAELELSHSVSKLMDCDQVETIIEAIKDGRLVRAELIEQDLD